MFFFFQLSAFRRQWGDYALAAVAPSQSRRGESGDQAEDVRGELPHRSQQPRQQHHDCAAGAGTTGTCGCLCF